LEYLEQNYNFKKFIMFLALIPTFTLSLTVDHFEDSHAEDYSLGIFQLKLNYYTIAGRRCILDHY